jgi:hypothetical protein
MFCWYSFLVCVHSGFEDVLGLWVTRLVSNKRHELLTLREHLGPLPVFGRVPVSHLFFSVLCFLCCLLPSCVPNVVSVSGLSIRNFPFCFSNVYLLVIDFVPCKLKIEIEHRSDHRKCSKPITIIHVHFYLYYLYIKIYRPMWRDVLSLCNKTLNW